MKILTDFAAVLGQTAEPVGCIHPSKSARGLAHSKTLCVGKAVVMRASVLECGGPPPLYSRPPIRVPFQIRIKS
jgi:hypothetical protein